MTSREMLSVHSRLWGLIILCGLGPCCSVRVCAQMVERSESASLYGVVLDPSGALVIQAWVELAPAGAGAEQSTPVDYQGRFGFERLVAGTYVVRVSATGFARFESKPLKLGNGQSRELNVRLVIETQQQELNVSDEDFAEDSNPNRRCDRPEGQEH